MNLNRDNIKKALETIKEKLRIKNPKTRKYVKRGFYGMLGAGALGFLLLVIFFFMIFFGYYGKLPGPAELSVIKNPVATEVYSADKVLLGKYYVVNRSLVKYKEINPVVFDALIATEDARFFEHGGVDARSLMRVLLKTLLLQNESAGGGSTLSQQLVKNVYGRKNYGQLSMPVNKIKEMIVAGRLEKIYDKDEILALYLNTVTFGEDVFGISTASERFFSTTPDKLKPTECAMLVGQLKATSYYSPRNHPERAKERRNTVLDQMVKYGKINKIEAHKLKKQPLGLKYNRITQSDGLAPYFRDHIRPELDKWCEENKKPDGSNYNVNTDGLKIYTTIDSRMQRYAEEAVAAHMAKLQEDFFKHWGKSKPWGNNKAGLQREMKNSERYKSMKENGASTTAIVKAFNTPYEMTLYAHKGEIKKKMTPMDSLAYYMMFLNTGFMVMDPQTGDIKAWVGGIEHKYFKYDHVKAKRQVGSTFKPIVYATALHRGAFPCQYTPNHLITYSEYQDWTPKNSDDSYGGSYSMQGALQGSVNTVSVQTIMKAGIPYVIEMAHEMGVTSDIPELPSIALGTPDISLFEMMQVYGTLANKGTHIPPTYLVRIEDNRGRTLHTFQSNYTKKKDVLHPEDALLMTKMMESVVDSGTARRLRWRYGLDNDIAGKTGTTQSQADGWFMGFTPKLVAGVWVGGKNRTIHFNSISLGQGANMALPIWGEFFQRLNKDSKFRSITNAQFEASSEYVVDLLNCEPYVPYDVISEPWITSSGENPDSVGFHGTLTQPGVRKRQEQPKTITKPKPRPRTNVKPPKKKKKFKKFWDRLRGG